jgi:phosphohistidine phosphatase
MRAHGIRPSLIVSSPATRAWSTAKIIAEAINYPREFLQKEKSLYLAPLGVILDVVMAQDSGFNNLMIVGHNPGLTDFVDFLVPGLTNNLPTAGVVSVEIEQDDWSLYERPAAKLLVHDWPKKPAA